MPPGTAAGRGLVPSRRPLSTSQRLAPAPLTSAKTFPSAENAAGAYPEVRSSSLRTGFPVGGAGGRALLGVLPPPPHELGAGGKHPPLGFAPRRPGEFALRCHVPDLRQVLRGLRLAVELGVIRAAVIDHRVPVRG